MYRIPQYYQRLVGRIVNFCSRGESGVTLIETLFAIALLGIIGTVLLGGMTDVYRSVPIADEQEIGKQLASNQVETLMMRPYAASYEPAPIPAIYGDYTANIDVNLLRSGNIQKITVTILHNDETSASLEIYKTNR